MAAQRSHGPDANDALSRIKVSAATPAAEFNDVEGTRGLYLGFRACISAHSLARGAFFVRRFFLSSLHDRLLFVPPFRGSASLRLLVRSCHRSLETSSAFTHVCSTFRRYFDTLSSQSYVCSLAFGPFSQHIPRICLALLNLLFSLFFLRRKFQSVIEQLHRENELIN